MDAKRITPIKTFCNGVATNTWFYSKEFYAVGIIAQESALTITDATVTEHMGGHHWETRLQSEGTCYLNAGEVVVWTRVFHN